MHHTLCKRKPIDTDQYWTAFDMLLCCMNFVAGWCSPYERGDFLNEYLGASHCIICAFSKVLHPYTKNRVDTAGTHTVTHLRAPRTKGCLPTTPSTSTGDPTPSPSPAPSTHTHMGDSAGYAPSVGKDHNVTHNTRATYVWNGWYWVARCTTTPHPEHSSVHMPSTILSVMYPISSIATWRQWMCSWEGSRTDMRVMLFSLQAVCVPHPVSTKTPGFAPPAQPHRGTASSSRGLPRLGRLLVQSTCRETTTTMAAWVCPRRRTGAWLQPRGWAVSQQTTPSVVFRPTLHEFHSATCEP